MHDLRFAARLLLKERSVTFAAIVALAAGIAVNNTVFTIANASLLRGLPGDSTNRLLYLGTRDANGRDGDVSYLDYQSWRESARAFSGIAAFQDASVQIADEGRAPERVPGTYIAAHAFRLIGERPILGRDFLAADDRPGAPSVVMLGAALWQTRYAGDRDIIGRTILLNGQPASVIGVMPDGFKFPFRAELWQPLAQIPGIASQPRDARAFSVIGRLADGVTLAQGQADLATIAARLARELPDTNRGVQPTAVPFHEYYNGGLSLILTALLGAVGFVLLIACANVASLLFARSARRAREVAVRTALGATRRRIIRQLLVESLLLAIVGGLLGFVFSIVGVSLFARAVDDITKPYWIRWTMDARVFTFLTTICVATTFVFGLAPALHLSKTNVSDNLKDGGRGIAGGRRVRRWTGVLVVAELALTLVLLGGAGLMMRSVLALARADGVVDTSNLLLGRLLLPEQRYATPEQRQTFYQRLEDRLNGVKTIASATMASALPFTPIGVSPRQLAVDGGASDTGARGHAQAPMVSTVTIAARYFETMGVAIVKGRAFTDLDGTPGHESAIVNQRFAATYFPNADPIGRRITLTDPTPLRRGASATPVAPASPSARPSSPSSSSTVQATSVSVTIVGISPTIRQSLGRPGPVVYLPHRVSPAAAATVIVRGRGEPAALGTIVREEVRAIDPELVLTDVLPLDRVVGQSKWIYRLFGTMFAIFAGVALALSAVGLYAVTAYGVSQRTQEIGVRIALGARAPQVWWLILRRVAVQVVIGFTIGIAGALGMGRLLRTMLIDTDPRDPVTLVSTAILLVLVSFAACVWPVRRATRLDPVAALRQE